MKTESFAAADDGTLLYYSTTAPDEPDEPARAPVVLCDGIACDGFIWKYLRPALARDRVILHAHYRGHGRSGSPRDKARIDIPALARDMIAVLRDAGLPPAIIAGHSMGTQIALELYRHAPDRVRALMLLCGSSGRITSTFHGTDLLRTVLPPILETVRGRRGVARAIWSRLSPTLGFRMAKLLGEVNRRQMREEDLRPYLEHITHVDLELFLGMLREAGEHDASDMLSSIGVPTLVIAAERDTFTPPAVAEAMASAIPDSDFLMLRAGSHAAPIEQPDLVELRVAKFLRDRVD
ncbi:MAG: alpha/beta hydrolase [Deltaproteobacteria bacterium]|nr:alpha/beta hydrolase [Deltaproteobacteria bacterium]